MMRRLSVGPAHLASCWRLGPLGGNRGNSARGPRKAPPVQHTLACTLEDLYAGVLKKMKIKRHKMEGGSQKQVEEILEIDVKPGWKKGTKITFPDKGDEAPGTLPADIIFVLDEKPHRQFRREGNDLVCTHRCSLADALCGLTVRLTHLDGRTLEVAAKDVITPGSEVVKRGEGMPITKQPGAKGDLRIKFEVQFPKSLTDAQKAQIREALPS